MKLKELMSLAYPGRFVIERYKPSKTAMGLRDCVTELRVLHNPEQLELACDSMLTLLTDPTTIAARLREMG